MQVTYIDEHLAFGGDTPFSAVIPSFSSSITNVARTTISGARLRLDFLGDFESFEDALRIRIEGFESPLIMSAKEYEADTLTFTIPRLAWEDIISDGIIDIEYVLGVDTQEGTETHRIEEYLNLSISWDIFVNSPPKFTGPSDLSVRENQTLIATLTARDPDGDALRYSIAGGDDASLFTVDARSGVLSFIQAPDFEAPHSVDGTNAYDVRIRVSDGTDSASRLFTVTVTDTAEIARFYNSTTGTHFYTADSAERDRLIATKSDYAFEAETFSTAATGTDSVSVHRFYNTLTGGHFYTADADEAAAVQSQLPQFSYEGEAFMAYADASEDRQALHRFYNVETKAHFYTSNKTERDNVMTSLPQYNYEGVAFYVDLV